MNRRRSALALGLLYLTLTFLGELLAHDHHQHAAATQGGDCAVCVWHATPQVTPVIHWFVTALPAVTCDAPVVTAQQPRVTFFSLSSPSRAPPAFS